MKILEDYYPTPITKIAKDEVLVVATLTVDYKYDSIAKLYGAKDSKYFGRSGRIYGIPVSMKKDKWLPYFTIKYYLDKFFFHCRKHSDTKFLVPHFTADVYTDEVLGRLFRPAKDIDNLYITKVFYPFAVTNEDLILKTDCGHEFAI